MKRLVLALAIVAVLLCATNLSAATYLHWIQSGADGFGDANNTASIWYGELSGYLYVGTQNANGGQLYRSPSGYNWYKSGADGFGSTTNLAIAPGATFGGALYAGTQNVAGGEVWSTSDGAVWAPMATTGFGDANNTFIMPMAVMGDSIYATTFNQVTGCEIWTSADGSSWGQANADGFWDVNNIEAYGSMVFGGYLYIGTRNQVTGGEIWRSPDGTTWTQANTDGFGDINNVDAYPFAVFGTDIYAGTYNTATGGEIWRSSNGTTWTQVNTDGFGDANNISAIPGGVMGGNLYAGTWNAVTGGEVWKSSDGTTWTQSNTDGFGDVNNVKADRVVAFEGDIYAATENSVTGCEVWHGIDYTIATVYDVQQGVVATGTNVRVDDVICTAVDHKPNTFGFFAQEEAGGPWSGVLCYSYGDQPDLVYNIEVGDKFTVLGEIQEYPEIGSQVTEISVDDAWPITKDYGLPAPQLMSCLDLRMIPDDPPDTLTERWEGVYMYVDTVQVTEHRTYDEWNVQEYHTHPGAYVNEDSLIIDDKLVDPTLSTPAIGDTLLSITGVFSEEYGSYKLWARGLDDLVFMGPAPGPTVLQAYATSDTSVRVIFDKELKETSAENIDNYFLSSETVITDAVLLLGTMRHVDLVTEMQPDNTLDELTVCDVESDAGFPMDSCVVYSYMAGITDIAYMQTPTTDTTQAPDASQINGEQVTLSGVVTSHSDEFAGFYMRDAAGAWNGTYIYWPGGTVSRGDVITVSGLVDEYNNMTEMISVDYFDLISTGPAPIPDIPPIAELVTSSDSAEAWEGCFVRTDSAEVFSMRDGNGEWIYGVASDSVDVGDFGDYIHPGMGSIIDIRGCFNYAFGNFRLDPRDTTDIVVLVPCTAGVDDVTEGTRGELRLYQNAPNPFAGATVVRFAVPSQMRARIAVYDVQGREVDVLTDSVMEPGSHQVQWNGTDRHGRQVSSGIYFYRFTTPNAVMHKKMVMLK